MTVVHRESIVPYSAENMFRLVNDVEAYPDFLPWCTGTTILSTSPHEMVASITFAKGSLSRSFTTLNRFEAPHSIVITLVEGPFKKLAGAWQFQTMANGTKVILDLEFSFSTHWLSIVVGPIFQQIANSLVQAFCIRAGSVYGHS